MPGPFPGMDPYLEHPGWWPDFHARFIPICCDALNEVLPDKYDVRIESSAHHVERTDIPRDMKGRDHWIRVLHRPAGLVVTAIEVLSPTNKVGPGYEGYQRERT